MSRESIATNAARETGQNVTLFIETLIKSYASKYPRPALRSEVLALAGNIQAIAALAAIIQKPK